jgi:tape measure domain-containing protein
MIADLDNFANITPFDNAELYENAKLLMNFGIEGKKIIPTLQMLGDVSGGNKEKLHSLSLAYAQVQSAGKLTGGDLLQMINAGFNPLNEISKKTGKSMGQLRDEMSNGQISFSQVESAFKSVTSEGGLFFNMMNKQSGTARGKLSTLLGTIKTKATDVGMSLIPTFTKLIDFAMELVKGIESLYHWYKKYASIINLVVSVIASAVIAYKSYVLIVATVKAITQAWAAAQVGLNVIMSLNPIGLVIAAIVALIAAITYVIMKTDGWAKQWTNFKNMFVASLDIMNSYFAIIWRSLVMEFGNAADGIVLTWKKAQNAIGLISDAELTNEKTRINAQMQARKEAIRMAEIVNMQAKKDFNKANKWELTWNKNANFKKVKDKITQALGIDTKTDENTVNNEDTNITNTANDITSGGSKQTNITINLGKFQDSINIYSQNVKEGINDMQEQIETALLRVLNSTNSLATN